ncbi:MAG: FAD-binding oxidoreductase [Hyphomicrobiaceae bacterium]
MADGSAILSADFSPQPFWWRDAPLPRPSREPLPQATDVAVIGGGVTGLSCAIELARAGTGVVLIDRDAIGWGASSRNGGAISAGVTLGRARSRADLEHEYGAERFGRMVEEAKSAYDDFFAFVRREGVDCDLRETGRFVAAHSAKALDELERRAALLNGTEGGEAEIVPRARIAEELGSSRYHGGLVVRRAAALHPARLTSGLADAASRHGVALHGDTDVRAIIRHDGSAARCTLQTSRGAIEAREVVVATNGYTGTLTPWLARRLVKVASAMVATEEIGVARVRAVLPKLRVYGDTKRLTSYFRPSPDGARVLFGGRARFLGQSGARTAAELHRTMTTLFPDLARVKVAHAWSGHLAFSFDYMPHLGYRDGVHYAMACNGSGLVILSHLGRRIADRITGRANRASAFSDLAFPTKPFYTGHAWFMPLIATWYELRDRHDMAH